MSEPSSPSSRPAQKILFLFRKVVSECSQHLARLNLAKMGVFILAAFGQMRSSTQWARPFCFFESVSNRICVSHAHRHPTERGQTKASRSVNLRPRTECCVAIVKNSSQLAAAPRQCRKTQSADKCVIMMSAAVGCRR